MARRNVRVPQRRNWQMGEDGLEGVRHGLAQALQGPDKEHPANGGVADGILCTNGVWQECNVTEYGKL